MIFTRTIGDIRITNVIEYIGPTHDPYVLYPDFDAAIIERNRPWMTNAHWYENLQRLVIAIQVWIVEAGDNVILIDAGVGNHKPRGAARMHMLNTLFPQWLAAAGAPFERVTHVVMTHLHGDHVGWNTIWDGMKWVPAFPNAKYLMPLKDLDHFRKHYDENPAADPSFGDSVQPVLDAGLVQFIAAGQKIASCLRVVDAPGHTPGHLNFWLESGGKEAVFCGDIFHHPLQITEPYLNTAYCVLPDVARQTRREFLDLAAQKHALVMPCHFGFPHCGYIEKQQDRYSFIPSPPELPQYC
jgi:glyoxylase-like metal-dependent hydrolase (beta-lactamase superfamily II)